jgi:hypothetical protein
MLLPSSVLPVVRPGYAALVGREEPLALLNRLFAACARCWPHLQDIGPSPRKGRRGGRRPPRLPSCKADARVAKPCLSAPAHGKRK